MYLICVKWRKIAVKLKNRDSDTEDQNITVTKAKIKIGTITSEDERTAYLGLLGLKYGQWRRGRNKFTEEPSQEHRGTRQGVSDRNRTMSSRYNKTLYTPNEGIMIHGTTLPEAKGLRRYDTLYIEYEKVGIEIQDGTVYLGQERQTHHISSNDTQCTCNMYERLGDLKRQYFAHEGTKRKILCDRDRSTYAERI
ncbi:hypothetical protein J6590_081519 [Homalodisca vitripennis]|nr:hypothetical protein J6590_081519 [Homalodisca vitripennis]